MLTYQKLKLNKQRNRVSEDILNWSIGNRKILNVISPPYNSTDIFINVILFHLFNEKKVAYITDGKCDNLNIVRSVKPYLNVKTRNRLLKVCDFKNAESLCENYDLIVYDNLSTFPLYDKCEIFNLLDKLSKENTKFIIYSIENILEMGEEIILPIRDDKKPLIEPRTILTRIDISHDIPFVIYDYLQCSIKSDRKVIICAPDDYKINEIYSYINKYCSSMTQNVTCVHKIHSDRVMSNFKRLKSGVYITDSFDIFNYNIQNVDTMVYFADNPKFDYKKLVYICAGVNRNRKNLEGEVIFLANEETNDMEKAKGIMRNFNKEAWEEGLLRI